jgi:hypothetical protein
MRTGMRKWLRLTACILCITVSTSSCGGSYEETVGDVKIPIPRGMTKSQNKSVELSLPGFGGALAAYEGKIAPNNVVEFYRQEMPARGWEPRIGLLSQGSMLTYVKDNKTVMVTVGKTDSGTSMTITVAGTQR